MYNTRMTNFPKLALFDVDGTIAIKGVVPSEILDGFKYLQVHGCMTTLSTGRGLVSLKGLLGDAFEKLVSPKAPIIVEHGTKIISRDGEVIFADYFSAEEIEHMIDFIRTNVSLFRLIWFNPKDRKVQVCCLNEADVQVETEYRGHYADVFSASLGKVHELLLEENLTNVTIKLRSHVKVENLKLGFTRTGISAIFQDGNMEFVKSNTNKGLAVLYAAKSLGVHPKEVLLAGNAINDVEMLDLDVGQAILVNGDEVRATILSYLSSPSQIICVNTPEELGTYLSSLKAGSD